MEESFEGHTPGALNPDTVSTKQQRIAELAKQSPEMGFTSLAHHIDLDWLDTAYWRTRHDGAPGVDGQTAYGYARDLEQNLGALLDRAKSGSYRAPPVRRVHIPKGKDKTRPIGIPTFEDKVLQRAVAMVLEPIYEHDFLECSYGFRPGRSAHQALASVRTQLMRMGGGWILEVDIEKFFDNLDHSHLRELLQRRVRDGVLQRLIGKWLHAGVMESGRVTYPGRGSPQGGVISPLLANVYLHYVLDVWFEDVVRPRMKGRAFMVRFADDFIMGFTSEDDALRVMEAIPKRLGRFGLSVQTEKTRLVPFQRPLRSSEGGKGPGSFDFLGFTYYWGRSRRGDWVVKRKTATSRLSRALRTIYQWCRTHRHFAVSEQHRQLSQKLRGHYAYYGLTCNSASLERYYKTVRRIWRRWLSRRSQKATLGWTNFERLLQRYTLPPPVVVRSAYRTQRNHHSKSRMH